MGYILDADYFYMYNANGNDTLPDAPSKNPMCTMQHMMPASSSSMSIKSTRWSIFSYTWLYSRSLVRPPLGFHDCCGNGGGIKERCLDPRRTVGSSTV